MEHTDLKETPTAGSMIPAVINEIEVLSSGTPFIEANTVAGTLKEIKGGHLIPVFLKDNEPVISHAEFIETTLAATMDIFRGEAVLKPNIRLSHPIKGRIPEAKHKPANELSESEKTIYYERMAFVIDVPSIYQEVDGNRINLTIGGVKAYNLDNLYNRSGVDQHFKVFIGFKNTVCCNLCITTDGYLAGLKVKNTDMLRSAIRSMLQEYDAVKAAENLKEFTEYELTEQQFAQLIGRCRMYKHLPDAERQIIPELMFGDSQINAVCNEYFKGDAFSRGAQGNLNLWKLYNLFTGANKSSYIDTFADRSLNAFSLVSELLSAVKNRSDCWYLQ